MLYCMILYILHRIYRGTCKVNRVYIYISMKSIHVKYVEICVEPKCRIYVDIYIYVNYECVNM